VLSGKHLQQVVQTTAMDYRIVTVPRKESGLPIGYFDRWHSVVFVGDRHIDYAQGWTRRRAERRAQKLARSHYGAMLQRAELGSVRETSYKVGPEAGKPEQNGPPVDPRAGQEADALQES
jgi:hypothetical protein